MSERARSSRFRVQHEPAFVLHSHDWSESSLVLDVFTRHHGRQAVLAKGVKRPTSSFRPVLLPLQPLLLAFGGEGEVHTLKAAEWRGGHLMPTGDALMAGFYLNELLMRLLPRGDAHSTLFDRYAQAVQLLSCAAETALDATLRGFELWLLQGLGHLPQLDVETLTLTPVQAQRHYSLRPEAGLLRVSTDDPAGLAGSHWMALQQALLDGGGEVAALITATANCPAALKTQLRQCLNYHCGVNTLQTRRVMMEAQNP